MNCPACGKYVEPGARFCSGCGARLVAEPSSGSVHTRYVRPREGRMIAGVCAGVALAHGWDVTVVRIVFGLVTFFTGLPLIVYLIAWIAMPNADYLLPPSTGATVS